MTGGTAGRLQFLIPNIAPAGVPTPATSSQLNPAETKQPAFAGCFQSLFARTVTRGASACGFQAVQNLAHFFLVFFLFGDVTQ